MAARQVGCSPRTVRRWVREGKLSADAKGQVSLDKVARLATQSRKSGRRIGGSLGTLGAQAVNNPWLLFSEKKMEVLLRPSSIRLFAHVVALTCPNRIAARFGFTEEDRKRPVRLLFGDRIIAAIDRLETDVAAYFYSESDTGNLLDLWFTFWLLPAGSALKSLPQLEQHLETLVQGLSTQTIFVLAARYILDAIKHQKPENRRFVFTQGELDEVLDIRTNATLSEAEKDRRMQGSRCLQRRLGKLAMRDSAGMRGCTLHWLLQSSRRMASYWRTRTHPRFARIKKELRDFLRPYMVDIASDGAPSSG